MPLLFSASLSLTPADIHPASSPPQQEGETDSVCVVVALQVCAHVYVCVRLRVPSGFGAGSGLIICIFSFELLFAALHAAQAPTGAAE